MKTKHTPGPWTLEAGRAITTESGTFCLTYGSEPGTGIPRFKSPTELDANARLIATAPELFEACRDALAYIIDTNPLEHGNPALGKVWGALEAVITKATRD